jgi:hypothetical protein
MANNKDKGRPPARKSQEEDPQKKPQTIPKPDKPQ